MGRPRSLHAGIYSDIIIAYLPNHIIARWFAGAASRIFIYKNAEKHDYNPHKY